MKLAQLVVDRQSTAGAALLRTPAFGMVLSAVIALLPRIMGLSDFVTTDEAYHWITRTERFRDALIHNNWVATAQSGHPGVTLLWLGSLGMAFERLAASHGLIPEPPLLIYLAWLRMPSALLEALLVPCAYLLLRRLVSPATALLGVLLWASSPYLIAHARLLHLDALLTTFVMLSVLLLLLATRPGSSPDRPDAVNMPALLGSAACCGLALLTKAPALIALPIAGVLLLWRIRAAGSQHWLGRTILLYLLWLLVALLLVLLLWPALLVDPAHALGMYISEIVDNGGRPNGDGQFFWGQALNDPGLLFYLVADLLRSTPAMLLGLLCVPLVWWRAAPGYQTPDRQAERQTLLALAVLVIFWTLVMSLGPKKFDRYVLPTWPALLVLAAAGLATLGRIVLQPGRWRGVAGAGLIVLAL